MLKHIPKILIILSFIIGVGLFLEGITSTIRYKEKTEDYESVEGYYKEYERHERNSVRRGRRYTYYLIYEYHVDGVAYTVKTDYGSGVIPEVGTPKEILYNPANPAEAVITGVNGPKTMLFVGLMFIMVPSVMVLAFLAAIGKLGNLGFNIMDIIIGFVMLVFGFGFLYFMADGFSIIELFKRFGPFALIPLMFIVVAFFLFKRGLFTKPDKEK